jgi:hypothetical protein
MTVDTKEICASISYLIGVRKDMLTQFFGVYGEHIRNLEQDRSATIIRILCKLRTALMQNFKKVDYEMRYNLKNLNTLDYFDQEDLKKLEEWGMPVVKANYRPDSYLLDITGLINSNIDNCRHIFYDWIKWEYIRDLFYVPKYTKNNTMDHEFKKYHSNKNLYPFQLYIHWEPQDCGSLVLNDRRFLKTLYAMNKDEFTDYMKFRDASSETKDNIYGFIDASHRTAVAVDCENSDVFKLYSTLKSLSADEISKIEKITLYDDENTTSAWEYLPNLISIPVEHVEVQRVTDRKSLVDIKMTAGVCKDFYHEGITSFIIVSSDSDFWGLIESLPDANFLVMYEYEKCGSAIKKALLEHEIYYTSIDQFCTKGTDELKKEVLLSELEKHLPDIMGKDTRELTRNIYEDTKLNLYSTEKEMDAFHDRYVKTIKLSVVDGKFTAVIQK